MKGMLYHAHRRLLREMRLCPKDVEFLASILPHLPVGLFFLYAELHPSGYQPETFDHFRHRLGRLKAAELIYHEIGPHAKFGLHPAPLVDRLKEAGLLD
jgi:hypothetical protein